MSSESRNPFWKTIGFRIWGWYTCIFLAIALLFLVVSTSLLSTHLAQRDQEHIQLKWNELASRYQLGGLEALKKESNAATFLVRVVGPNRELQLLRNDNLFEDFQIELLESAQPDGHGWIFVPERSEEQDFSLLEGAERLEVVSGQLPGKIQLQVGNSSERREDFRENFHILFFVSLIPLFLLGGTILTFRTLRPLRSIISSVRSIQAGHMETRVPTSASGDELDQLALLFNDMLNRIQRLVEGMRNSLDNVAHDLRTPITRLRAVAETARNWNPIPKDTRKRLPIALKNPIRF